MSAPNAQALLAETLADCAPLLPCVALSACDAVPRTEVSVDPTTPDETAPKLACWLSTAPACPPVVAAVLLLPLACDVAPVTLGELAVAD